MSSDLAPTAVALPAPGRYRVDPTRSTVSFTTRHMFGLAGVRGRFTILEADIVVGDPVTDSSLHAVIDAASFATGTAKRDEHVTGPKFLDTTTHPEIVVDATSVAQRDGIWVASGTVRARGTSAPLELILDTVQDAGPDEVRFTAHTTIDRYAHGVTASKGMAGRRLNITVDAVAAR